MNTKLRQKIREPLSINNNMSEDTILRLHTISRHNNLFLSRPTNKVTKKKKNETTSDRASYGNIESLINIQISLEIKVRVTIKDTIMK